MRPLQASNPLFRFRLARGREHQSQAFDGQRLVGKYIDLTSPAVTRPWIGRIGLSWDRGCRSRLPDEARPRQADLMRAVFLHEMNTPHRYFVLV